MAGLILMSRTLSALPISLLHTVPNLLPLPSHLLLLNNLQLLYSTSLPFCLPIGGERHGYVSLRS